MLKQFIEQNQDRGWFYVVVPKGAIVTSPPPKTTFLRSTMDMSYFQFRDLAEFFSVNDGQHVVDVAVTMTPQFAVSVDLAANQMSFTKGSHNIPVCIWHQMIHAYKDPYWVRACTGYYNLFCSYEEMRSYRVELLKSFKPSFVKDTTDKDTVVSYGVRFNEIRAIARAREKPVRPTILFGFRQNAFHGPNEAAAIVRKLYELGYDFDLIVTTPDNGFAPVVKDLVDDLPNTTSRINCTQDEFFALLGRAHFTIAPGIAGSPTYAAEYLAADTVALCSTGQWMNDVAVLAPGYKYVWKDVNEAVNLLRSLWSGDGPIANHSKFLAQGWSDKVSSFDLSVKHRETYDYFYSTVGNFRRRESGQGRPGTRARIVMQLARMGGRASLSEVVVEAPWHGFQVKDESIGRWVTRKLIHDILVSNPAVTDLCDGPEPVYELDFARFGEWAKEVDMPFTGPTQVKKVVGGADPQPRMSIRSVR
jgi:hypothetical protein